MCPQSYYTEVTVHCVVSDGLGGGTASPAPGRFRSSGPARATWLDRRPTADHQDDGCAVLARVPWTLHAEMPASAKGPAGIRLSCGRACIAMNVDVGEVRDESQPEGIGEPSLGHVPFVPGIHFAGYEP